MVKVYIPGFAIPASGIKYGDYACFYDENGNALVFDAGQRPASAVFREWIKKQGFKKIWAVGTHAHTDHINGILDIINDPDIKLDKVWMTKYDAIKSYTNSSYKYKSWYERVCNMYERCAKGLYDLCVKNNISVGWLNTGTHIRIGNIHCQVLWQALNSYGSPGDDGIAGSWLNNFSPLVLFDFGYFCAGDNRLSHAYARNACKRVIVANIPHHGNYADKQAFAKLRPKAAFYNYGEKGGAIGKDAGFTSWTIPVIRNVGADIWNNFTHGNITMTFTDKEVTISSQRGGSKTYSLDEYKNWSRSDTELAVEVMLQIHGKGDTRKNRLGTRYSDVQKIVEVFCRDHDALIDSIADYIIRGLAGNGDTRKEILGGYYAEAQARVNEKLRGLR